MLIPGALQTLEAEISPDKDPSGASANYRKQLAVSLFYKVQRSSHYPISALSINQSINQSNFYNTNIPSAARLSGAAAKSVFNSKIEKTVP